MIDTDKASSPCRLCSLSHVSDFTDLWPVSVSVIPPLAPVDGPVVGGSDSASPPQKAAPEVGNPRPAPLGRDTLVVTRRPLLQEDKLHTKEKVFTWSSNEPAPSG